jgi:hypothetical protein
MFTTPITGVGTTQLTTVYAAELALLTVRYPEHWHTRLVTDEAHPLRPVGIAMLDIASRLDASLEVERTLRTRLLHQANRAETTEMIRTTHELQRAHTVTATYRDILDVLAQTIKAHPDRHTRTDEPVPLTPCPGYLDDKHPIRCTGFTGHPPFVDEEGTIWAHANWNRGAAWNADAVWNPQHTLTGGYRV